MQNSQSEFTQASVAKHLENISETDLETLERELTDLVFYLYEWLVTETTAGGDPSKHFADAIMVIRLVKFVRALRRG